MAKIVGERWQLLPMHARESFERQANAAKEKSNSFPELANTQLLDSHKDTAAIPIGPIETTPNSPSTGNSPREDSRLMMRSQTQGNPIIDLPPYRNPPSLSCTDIGTADNTRLSLAKGALSSGSDSRERSRNGRSWGPGDGVECLQPQAKVARLLKKENNPISGLKNNTNNYPRLNWSTSESTSAALTRK
jgi:hypothetical protein